MEADLRGRGERGQAPQPQAQARPAHHAGPAPHRGSVRAQAVAVQRLQVEVHALLLRLVRRRGAAGVPGGGGGVEGGGGRRGRRRVMLLSVQGAVL